MDSDTVIKVENLSKKFCRSLKRSMLYGAADAAKTAFGLSPKSDVLRQSEFWALKDISFELKRGERLGLIGANGSGKTTLLRLLTGIFPPDAGKISIRGRVGALIAIGAGFHPHMSGRENIYLNGVIMGMNKREIDKKLDVIIDFAEIPDGAIDAPVSTYSSGMQARLGFSVAVHVEPEILLVDEVLSVGDYLFATKCSRKLAVYIENGGSLVLVSHSHETITNCCDSGVWLDSGEIRMQGNIKTISSSYRNAQNLKYLKYGPVTSIKDSYTSLNLALEYFANEVSDLTVGLYTSNGIETNVFQSGESIIVKIGFSVCETIKTPRVDCRIKTNEPMGRLLYVDNFLQTAAELGFEDILRLGRYTYTLQIDELKLGAGLYDFNIQLCHPSIHTYYYAAHLYKEFVVHNSRYQRLSAHIVDTKVKWELEEELIDSCAK